MGQAGSQRPHQAHHRPGHPIVSAGGHERQRSQHLHHLVRSKSSTPCSIPALRELVHELKLEKPACHDDVSDRQARKRVHNMDSHAQPCQFTHTCS
eukprot:1162012-Pelagomonas_calceolata.AAC.2